MVRGKSGNKCGYWDCQSRIPDDEFLCAKHHKEWVDGLIDRCPKCGRFKDIMYYLCFDCYLGRSVTPWKTPAVVPTPNKHYKVEYSDAWTDGYMRPDRVFVYILKLADGGFYVGHTTDIRKRFSEHRNAKIPSTAGHNPQLRYLEIMANQRSAELRETELKRLIESNPRQIHLMIRKFQDHLVEFMGE